jgi:hypothetical protein
MRDTICIICADHDFGLILWSDLLLVAFSSVIEVVYCLVIYIVGPTYHEIGLWPRPSKDVPFEEGQMH